MERRDKFQPQGLVRDEPAVRAFRHLLRAHAAVVDHHKRYIAEHLDLSIAEFDMIAELGNTEGRRMGHLAHQMVTSPANVTRVANRLEKRGLVQRRRAADSDREVVASLTPAGVAFFEEHFLEVVHVTVEVMRTALEEPELDALAALCQRLHTVPGG